MQLKLNSLFCLIFSTVLLSCQKPFVANVSSVDGQQSQFENDPVDSPSLPGENPESEEPIQPTPEPNPDPFELSICSAINFNQVTWPSVVPDLQRDWFALALNVTGSFEGPLSWSVIANNFDDMGMSLGLLQQNFGTGSLQPMLLEMQKREPANYNSSFSAKNLQSLNAMLQKWQNTLRLNDLEFDESRKDQFLFFPDNMNISPLDEDSPTAGAEGGELSARAVSRNQVSVNWAINTLYSGTTFKADWKTQFKALAEKPYYRSLQIDRAATYHERALEYFRHFNFFQVRFYLLMYDFVVQNGGFKETHLAQFENFRKNNPNASEETLARKLIDIRIVDVRAKYKADVMARKMTILTGKGTVHGRKRTLPKEHCYDPVTLIP